MRKKIWQLVGSYCYIVFILSDVMIDILKFVHIYSLNERVAI